LKKLNYSKTIQKQLSSAKEGTIVDTGHAHSNGNHLLRRMTKEEIKAILDIQKTHQELAVVEKEIEKQTKTLQTTKKYLSSVIRKQNKELEKAGVPKW
jgi:ABC-type oligopeptide transport system ATPase subunit